MQLGVRLIDERAASVEPAVRAYGDKIEWKAKELFMAVRLAASGRAASPPLFDTLCVIGKELVRRRLRKAAEALRAMK